MRFTRFSAFLAIFSVLLAPALPAHAEPSTGGWAPAAGTGADVRALLRTTSGNLIVGGVNSTFFVGVGGALPPASLASLDQTTGAWSMLGSDNTFNGGFFYAFAELPGGDIVAAGELYSQTDPSIRGLGRFNPATRLWSNMGGGLKKGPTNNGTGQSLAVLPGGDLIVGGDFTSASGVAASNIARYNPTTGVWSALGSGTNGIVYSLLALPSGELIVGGNFSTANGVSTGKIARYNPVTGVWSSLGSGGPPTVYALAVSPTGDIVAGGAGQISLWNHTTHAWSTLGTVTPSAVYSVAALAFLPGGDLLVGGSFTKVGSVSVLGLARYNFNTSTWSAVGSGLAQDTSPAVRALLVLPDGDFLAGGMFLPADTSLLALNIARCNPSTGVWSEVATHITNRAISSMTVSPEGDVYAAGKFTKAGNSNANGIASYNSLTGVWSAIGSGISGTSSKVSSLAALAGGDLIAGGAFTAVDGVPANNIARYSKSTKTWSSLDSGLNGNVEFVGVLPNGEFFVSGSFTAAGNVSLNGLARYNPSTGTWSSAGSIDFNRHISQTLNLPSGEVVVAGNFSSINGVAASGLARYNPTTGVWSELISGFQSVDTLAATLTTSIALNSDGNLWIHSGIGFSVHPGADYEYFAAHNLNTGIWTRPSLPLEHDLTIYPASLALLPGGELLVSGDFWFLPTGEESPSLARYNPNTDTWTAAFDPYSGFFTSYSSVLLGVLPNGDYVVAGDLFPYGGRNINNYFAHNASLTLPAILNQPASQSACRSGSATLSVNVFAPAGSVTYQWRKGAAPIDGTLNPSALTPTLNLTNIQSSAAYDCVVNGYAGTVISNPATLSVCASDLNCDGYVEDADFQIFVVQYNILDCADPTMPNACSADINQDGFVDDADFQQFVVAYNILLCQ